MPIVNGKEYPYTAKGIAAAKAAKRSYGDPLVREAASKNDTAGEKNKQMNLKKKALKVQMDKRVAEAKAMRKKRKGESDSAHKARLRTYDFGNPNE
jgi:hypothetical protein